MSCVKKVFINIILVFKWIYVHIFSPLFYDKKYLTGKCFLDGIHSVGWLWAARDIHYRLHTLQNAGIKWPVSPYSQIGADIQFHPDDLGVMNNHGCYFQTLGGKIVIGKGTYIARNVGIITSNHDVNDPDNHIEGKDVVLGQKCWIGMNSMILPGVVLGDHTTVGAGSVVTKSFEKGYCVIAGNPARIIRKIETNNLISENN